MTEQQAINIAKRQIMAGAHGLSAHTMAIVANNERPGIDWRGSPKGDIASDLASLNLFGDWQYSPFGDYQGEVGDVLADVRGTVTRMIKQALKNS